MFVGIDVGADRLHCVAFDARRRAFGRAYLPNELEHLCEWLAHAEVIAIDAPAQVSCRPHADDPLISQKFREARCAEIALGRDFGVWVPFVAPSSRPAAPWMETGFALYQALAELQDPRLVEVYPYGCFRALAALKQLPKKMSMLGVRRRVELLRAAGVQVEHLSMWSHDALDAGAAAVTARDVAGGMAIRVTCGHDDSAIWLPRSP